jgi:hypothetical protein
MNAAIIEIASEPRLHAYPQIDRAAASFVGVALSANPFSRAAAMVLDVMFEARRHGSSARWA